MEISPKTVTWSNIISEIEIFRPDNFDGES
jgi:hypothetical protein